MENELRKKDSAGDLPTSLMLLELSATDDLNTFKRAVEEEGHDIDILGLWYGRRIGLKKMGFEERTPLMVAAMFGSKDIVTYILQTGQVDVNRASGSDGATALHCAAAGGSLYSHEVIQLLVDSGGDVTLVDSNGNRPLDVISPCLSFSSRLKRKTLDNLLKKEGVNPTEDEEWLSPKSSNDSPRSEKKEYPVDPSLPDIKNGIYGTDEFRIYTFKVKPCSRAYSHDWTECPFVHPGENAKRRDPRKYHYSCVPCPEFRKGACPKGDACEYAHGIFECWLHPAQYRTRLCKDETSCARRVCFFAHKPEELRPLYASTGSAVPSPRSYSSSAPSFDMGSFSPRGGASGNSSPIGGATAWQNQLNVMPPPALLLPSSRLKAALNARDMDFEAAVRRQQLLDEFAGLTMSSPTSWNGFSREMGRLGGLKPANVDDVFGSMDPALLAQVQSQNSSRQRYSTGMPSSPVRIGSHFNMDPCGSPVSNARLASFANRSQSFIDRSTINRLPDRTPPSHLSDWGSSDGKVEWGVHGDELNKLRKSASFGFRTNETAQNPRNEPEPDVPWVQSLVKDGEPITSAKLSFEEQLKQQYYLNNGGSSRIPPWAEQEPMMA
ncbi:zinc finger CCCH domain-containing protein 66-like [Silene latifolia]|uniref:zinc finger CCCH domain-containing protein 66-like n=1 Tax=Silene latifolia TaxID=37657 RepID=UPI003D77A71D